MQNVMADIPESLHSHRDLCEAPRIGLARSFPGEDLWRVIAQTNDMSMFSLCLSDQKFNTVLKDLGQELIEYDFTLLDLM